MGHGPWATWATRHGTPRGHGTWDIGHREWEHGGHGTMYRDTGLWTWSWGIPLYFPQGTLLNIVGQQCPPMSPRVPSCPLMCPPMSPHVPPCPTMFFPHVRQCPTMSNNVHQCPPMSNNVQQCPTMSNNVLYISLEHAQKRHQQCGLPLQHAVLQEVVEWYKKDKTRMQDYNMFDEEKVMSLATTKWTPPRVSR